MEYKILIDNIWPASIGAYIEAYIILYYNQGNNNSHY